MTTATRESWIPKISTAKLLELCARIRPVIRFARGTEGLFQDYRGVLYYIKARDPRRVSYTWDPTPEKRATGLKKLTEFVTYHSFSYQGFFKPSVAEVLAQIPEDILDKVVAFEIIEKSESLSDLNANSSATNAGYHVATTRLYTKN